jgi:hypothetical protein
MSKIFLHIIVFKYYASCPPPPPSTLDNKKLEF